MVLGREMAEEAIPSTRRGGLRAELDISPTLQSDLDGRGSSCVPFKIGDYNGGVEGFDIRRMEEKAAELEKDLIMKELETLDFLEALGTTKKILKDLKLQRHQQALRCMESPEHVGTHVKEMIHENCHPNPLASTDPTLLELKQANMNICMNTEEEEGLIGVVSLAEELNSLRLKPGSPVNPPCEQVKMVVETYDTAFLKQNKTGLKTAKMRLIAARKMEEAARAAEALALAEMTILSSGMNQDGLCFLEPPRSPLTLQALMKEDLSTNTSRMEILRRLEEVNEEVIQSKKALERALQRVEIASVKQLEAEEAFHQWNIESWKAVRSKRVGSSRTVSHVNRHEPALKRNVSFCNVLNGNIDEKQLITPRRKFRFIH